MKVEGGERKTATAPETGEKRSLIGATLEHHAVYSRKVTATLATLQMTLRSVGFRIVVYCDTYKLIITITFHHHEALGQSKNKEWKNVNSRRCGRTGAKHSALNMGGPLHSELSA